MDDKLMRDGVAEFNSRIKKLGFFFVTFALITNFLPAIYVSSASGLFPTGTQLSHLFLGAAAAFGVGWFIQPVSFFPMLNMAGTSLCWIVGNVAEVRIPPSLMAQKATNCELGTPKAEIMGTIGVCTSVFVSCAMISFFTLVGMQIIPLLPEAVTRGLGFILPAILGAVYANLCITNKVLGIIVIIASIGGAFIFPRLGVPGGLNVLVNIVVAIIIARIYFMASSKKA